MAHRWRSVAVVGAGAVGSFYGGLLARAGHRVMLIGRPAHVEAIRRHGLRLEMAGRVETIPLDASADLASLAGAEVVLFCVKSTDTDDVARAMAPYLEPGAVVVSLQNGVENAATIARHVGQTVVPAAVYVATAMPEAGAVTHFGRGDLVIGPLNAAAAGLAGHAGILEDLAALFATAGIETRISADVIRELWSKLLVNCAYNALSALAQAPYAQIAAVSEARAIQHAVVREVVAVAAADGVDLPLQASIAAMEAIAGAMPAQRSSTAQDVDRRKPTEIDHLNGFIARRGRELGVRTPVNQTLHGLVKLLEAGYHGAGQAPAQA